MQVSVQEIHNSMSSPTEEGGLNEARDTDNNTIISYSTLRKILPPRLKNMADRYKVMCGCECCIYDIIMNY